MRPNIDGLRELTKNVPYDNQRWSATKRLIAYIDELENMPLVQTIVEQRQEIEKLQGEMNNRDIMAKSLLRTIKSHLDENWLLSKALKNIRTRLGDFQEPWSDREREIDEIARKALEGASK